MSVFAMMFIVPLLNIFEIYFVKGTFYSLDIGDVAIADPVAILQAVMSAELVVAAMVVSLIIPVLLMILLGRVWCSWMCPYHFLVEMLEKLRGALRLKSLRPEYYAGLPDRANRVRLIFMLTGLLITGIAGIPLLNLISAPGVISAQALVVVKFGYVTFEIVFIIVILLTEFFFASYFWCRYFCPTGTFLSLMKSSRGMHIGLKEGFCSECGECRKSCPMALFPMKDGHNLLCHNCGDCITVCPDNRKKPTLGFLAGRR